MKTRTTLALLVICILLGCWVWWDLNRDSGTPEDVGPLLTEVTTPEIQKLVIERWGVDPEGESHEKQKLVFEKLENLWWLTEPVRDVAGLGRIVSMIDQPCTRWVSSYVDSTDDMERFGISDNSTRVTLFHPGGQVGFRIGKRSAYRQGVYAMIDGADRIGLMDRDFGGLYELPVDRYRRSRVVAFAPDQVSAVKLTRLQQGTPLNRTQLKLVRDTDDPQKWTATLGSKPLDMRDGKPGRLLAQLQALKYRRFLESDSSFDLRSSPVKVTELHEIQMHFSEGAQQPTRLALAMAPIDDEPMLIVGEATRSVWGVAGQEYPAELSRIIMFLNNLQKK